MRMVCFSVNLLCFEMGFIVYFLLRVCLFLSWDFLFSFAVLFVLFRCCLCLFSAFLCFVSMFAFCVFVFAFYVVSVSVVGWEKRRVLYKEPFSFVFCFFLWLYCGVFCIKNRFRLYFPFSSALSGLIWGRACCRFCAYFGCVLLVFLVLLIRMA